MYFWGEKMLSNLFRTLLDSNPQPSDRQADTPFLNPYTTTTYMRVFGLKRGLQVNNK